jgi:hypothetical protein
MAATLTHEADVVAIRSVYEPMLAAQVRLVRQAWVR